MKLEIISVAYKRAIPLRILIDCFLIQTNPNWNLHIVHDGPAPEDVSRVLSLYDDPRITFRETEQVNGLWGHPNRKWMLEQMEQSSDNYVLITNDDNYYVPTFVDKFLSAGKGKVGFVFCDTVHSYMDYDVLRTRIKEGHIDMGSFIVRMDIAKKVGFKHMYEQADGRYAEECALMCSMKQLKIAYLSKCYFIHN